MFLDITEITITFRSNPFVKECIRLFSFFHLAQFEIFHLSDRFKSRMLPSLSNSMSSVATVGIEAGSRGLPLCGVFVGHSSNLKAQHMSQRPWNEATAHH
jgi:hypothetical protein